MALVPNEDTKASFADQGGIDACSRFNSRAIALLFGLAPECCKAFCAALSLAITSRSRSRCCWILCFICLGPMCVVRANNITPRVVVMQRKLKAISSRDKPQRRAARRMLKKPPGRFEQLDLSLYPSAPEWMTRCFRNNRYVVMIDDDCTDPFGNPAARAYVQRHDDLPIPNHWRELMSIKNEIFGPESFGFECYPPQSELTDQANIYWLWVPSSNPYKENRYASIPTAS